MTVAGFVAELAEAQFEDRQSKLETALGPLDLLIGEELGFVRLDPSRASSASRSSPTGTPAVS